MATCMLCTWLFLTRYEQLSSSFSNFTLASCHYGDLLPQQDFYPPFSSDPFAPSTTHSSTIALLPPHCNFPEPVEKITPLLSLASLAPVQRSPFSSRSRRAEEERGRWMLTRTTVGIQVVCVCVCCDMAPPSSRSVSVICCRSCSGCVVIAATARCGRWLPKYQNNLFLTLMTYVFALTQKMAFVRDNYTVKLKLFNVWFICEFLTDFMV